MNNHYIPRLLLKQFANSEKVNTYDFTASSFSTKKLKNTFVSKDIFDKELESAFATKLEGPFGDLLNHKLLRDDTILIDRRENLLMRKFLLTNFLRSPLVNISWEEMLQRTRLQDHPSMRAREFLIKNYPNAKEMFEKMVPSPETYISDLKKAMEIDSLEDIANSDDRPDVSGSLRFTAGNAIVTAVAFWDSSTSGQEFILPKLPGACQMDYVSIFYKSSVIRSIYRRKRNTGA